MPCRGVRCGFSSHAHPVPQGTLAADPTPTGVDERDALRLVRTATEVARRLRVVCADWPAGQFGALVYEEALVRLGGELGPDAAGRLRREYEAHCESYPARLRERAG